MSASGTTMVRDRILALSQTVSRVLDAYIEVHDHIFGLPLHRAIRRMIPIPGIFERIPYAEHRDTLARLWGELSDARKEVQVLLSCTLVEGTSARFLESLQQYCGALLDTIYRLQQICHEMAVKAEGGSGLTWDEYRRSLDQYERSRQEYVHLGAELNVIFRTLQHEP